LVVQRNKAGSSSPRSANKVRIIGGEWRSRVLSFPASAGLRPTADRVRETVFNWLGQTLEGKTCLDLFAGSGALGFEALSRYAAHVTLVEKNARVHAALQANAALLGARKLDLVCADGLAWLQQDRGVYDVIFLDPPFADALLPKLWPALGAHLKTDGAIYLESGAPLAVPEGWTLWRSGRAGMVYYGLARRQQHA
jgi:16S rRNA (guanine966-N2)-methyltransferase